MDFRLGCKAGGMEPAESYKSVPFPPGEHDFERDPGG